MVLGNQDRGIMKIDKGKKFSKEDLEFLNRNGFQRKDIIIGKETRFILDNETTLVEVSKSNGLIRVSLQFHDVSKQHSIQMEVETLLGAETDYVQVMFWETVCNEGVEDCLIKLFVQANRDLNFIQNSINRIPIFTSGKNG